MRFVMACAAAALLAATVPVTVARAAEAPQETNAPSARRLELTRQYIDLAMTDQFGDVIRQMLGDQFSSDQSMQSMPDADRRFIIDLTTELTTDMVPQMIAEMVPVYAAVFTEEELVALIDFYSTPMGRSISEKTMQVMPEANRAVMAVVPRMLEKMATRMCQHYNCTPAELEELQRGMREGAGLADDGAAPARQK